ncbi:MAG: biotin carboxylase N-terminal domain-containing protein, partial [Desulfobulbaceae bacterium]|nr:biotin carboxylase N-terminal domain-containing protein [Desulfobulbaceae bacterium]
MFTKILIANRGEIAIRIIKTCKRLGIATVAVYSDVDARSLHVREADEAVHIGPAPATSSYLVIDKIVGAALEHGCQAIHPGYGFLSENAGFAEAVTKAGIAFIGPKASVIAAMGDKIEAKRLAIKAGIPVVPGHNEAVSDLEEIETIVAAIGYPIIFKPAAGGGGRGMRVVTASSELATSLGLAKSETKKAFGDDRIFLERYITSPRHIEIQIIADQHGNVVSLGERECSIQRRHQKVIEEAPSPAISPELRQEMGDLACALAREAGYANAGTVEFILDQSGEFFFMEMNTRLQVEHPVTEMVTGLDLVELQLRVANNELLPIRQEEVVISGSAIEARICAEDPIRNFLPATGMVTRYSVLRGRD